MEHLGRILQRYINDSPYTLREFAKLVGSDTGRLSKVFQGKSLFSVNLANKFRVVFEDCIVDSWLHYQVDYFIWESSL